MQCRAISCRIISNLLYRNAQFKCNLWRFHVIICFHSDTDIHSLLGYCHCLIYRRHLRIITKILLCKQKLHAFITSRLMKLLPGGISNTFQDTWEIFVWCVCFSALFPWNEYDYVEITCLLDSYVYVSLVRWPGCHNNLKVKVKQATTWINMDKSGNFQ